MKCAKTCLAGAMALSAFAACSSPSSTSTTFDAGLPVADPGGPFTTSVGPTQTLDGLSLTDSDTLCRDLAIAYNTFLAGGVAIQRTCLENATASAAFATKVYDGGVADFQAVCAMGYADCVQAPPATFTCPLDYLNQPPQACHATVEDLSACLNEIAAADPFAACIDVPGCDAGIPLEAGSPDINSAPTMDAALDANSAADVDGAPSLATLPVSTLPACARLRDICSVMGAWAVFVIPC